MVFVSKYGTLSTTVASFNLPRCYPKKKPRVMTIFFHCSFLSYDSHGHVTGLYRGPIYCDSPREYTINYWTWGVDRVSREFPRSQRIALENASNILLQLARFPFSLPYLATTWGAIVRSGNCLVVFHNPFFPFQPLFKLTKISLKFMCTPALTRPFCQYLGHVSGNAKSLCLFH